MPRHDSDNFLEEINERLLTDPTLRLVLRRGAIRGIGVVEAVPSICFQEACIDASSISKQLSQQINLDYLQIDGGKCKVADLQAAGIAGYGRASGGYSLDPIPLSPWEIFFRESSRLDGPWRGLEIDDLTLPDCEDPHLTARKHLDLLRRWGFSGGLFGTVKEYGEIIAQFLQDYSREEENARILVVGTKTVLNYLNRFVDHDLLLRLDNNPTYPLLSITGSTIVLVTPTWLEQLQSLQSLQWDIVVLMNADSLVKSATSKLFNSLRNLTRLLFLGLFGDIGFRQRNPAREAFNQLFELQDTPPPLIWRYLLRDPREKPRELLDSARASQQNELLGAYHAPHLGPNRGKPIAYDYETSRFLGEARRFQDMKGKPTRFVQFYSFRPNFIYLNERQLSWYLYWRGEVRQQNYLPTGLDYITLHAFELINRIGVSDLLDGYEQLERLWLNYRQAFPALDGTLLPWLVDYLLLNGSPIDPFTPYKKALYLGVNLLPIDLFLKEYLEVPWEEFPFPLVERLIDHPISQSKVYADGHAKELELNLLAAISVADSWLQENQGAGLWAHFKPKRAEVIRHWPFARAIYAERPRLINLGTALPYSRQAPLRYFLTNLAKLVENHLRIQHGFRGRLRVNGLSADLIQLVTNAFEGEVERKRPRIQVSIDLKRVAELTAESDEVRSMLVSEEEEIGATDRPQPDPASGERTVLADQVLMTQGSSEDWPISLWEALVEQERALVIALFRSQRGLKASELSSMLEGDLIEPLIDQVNHKALEFFGDLLIVEENGVACLEESYKDELAPVIQGDKE